MKHRAVFKDELHSICCYHNYSMPKPYKINIGKFAMMFLLKSNQWTQLCNFLWRRLLCFTIRHAPPFFKNTECHHHHHWGGSLWLGEKFCLYTYTHTHSRIYIANNSTVWSMKITVYIDTI